MDKHELLDELKAIKYLDCICQVIHETGYSYGTLKSFLVELEDDGEIHLSLGSPERCIGISIIEPEDRV